MTAKSISGGENVQLFYQNAQTFESKASDLNLPPFDSEFETLFQKIQGLYSKALPILKDQPVEAQKLTTKNLKIQLLHAMVEQRDFQGLLIATVASTSDTRAKGGNDHHSTGSEGKVSYNDKNNLKVVANLKDRVTDDTVNFNFN